MSSLSNELATLLKKNGMRQIDFTKRAGMHVSTVSRIFTGVTLNPDDKDLDTIIGLLAKTPRERAELVRARIRDAYKGKHASLVKVILNADGKGPKSDWQDEISVAPQVQEAIRYLCTLVPGNPEVGKSIIQLADLMGFKQRG